MHIFVDANQAPFAADAYLRVLNPTKVDVAFVIRKTRLALDKCKTSNKLNVLRHKFYFRGRRNRNL